MRTLFFALLLSSFVYYFYGERLLPVAEKPVPASLMQQIYTPPLQGAGEPSGMASEMAYGDGRIEFVASYDVTARVLSRDDYFADRGSKIAPMDLALGWGPMSAPGLSDRLSITQGGRFYHYRWRDAPPIDPDQIILNSANTHIVPATDGVLRRLKKIRKHQIVRLQGWLINYDEPGGAFSWRSSVTRGDTGWGACELLYVQNVTIY